MGMQLRTTGSPRPPALFYVTDIRYLTRTPGHRLSFTFVDVREPGTLSHLPRSVLSISVLPISSFLKRAK